jgi:hypothetical protein
MNKVISLLFFLALAAAIHSGDKSDEKSRNSNGDYSQIIKDFRAVISNLMKESGVPRLAVALAFISSTLLSHSWGLLGLRLL